MCVLHLEDEGPLREILNVALMASNPKLVLQQFISSDDALEYIKSHQETIDIYILDIRVPGKLNGLELAEEIRKLGSIRPIIITSAYRKPEQTELDRLKCTWMEKPWHILDMPKTVFSLVSSS